jgi:PD-(D/E)XK endonuclease
MTTDQKGAIAEAAIALAAIRLGIGVFRPLGDERYDLIFDLRPRLVRVQCKWATRYGEIVAVRCYSTRRTRNGLLKKVYSMEEVDAIAAYCPDIDRCFFFSGERIHLRSQLNLRLGPTLNNQRRGINWADDFDFAATLGRDQGAVAQLGERLPGRQ